MLNFASVICFLLFFYCRSVLIIPICLIVCSCLCFLVRPRLEPISQPERRAAEGHGEVREGDARTGDAAEPAADVLRLGQHTAL